MGTLRISNDRGPLRVSTVNGRYLTDNAGEPIFLAGWNYWNFVQDGGSSDPPPAFDFDAAISHTVSHGLNHMLFYQWDHMMHSGPWYMRYSPFARTGPGDAYDGNPKFNLTTWDTTYFNRMRTRIAQAAANGIYVTVNLWHGFSFTTWNAAWSDNPYKAANNINSIDGDPTSTGEGKDCLTLVIPAVTAIQEDYVEHMIDVLNDLPNVIWQIAEEPDMSYTRLGHDPVEWTEYWIDYIQTYEAGKAKQHPVLWAGPDGADEANQLASDAECMTPGNEMLSDGTKVVINDTDHINWQSEEAKWPWRAFALGNGGFWIMDGGYSTYDDQGGTQTYANSEGIRNNNGYVLTLSQMADILHTQPQDGGGTPCSTGYCLYPTSSAYHEYVAFQPSDGSCTLNLSSESGTFYIRKVNVADGSVDTAQSTTGGDVRTITQPSGWTSGWAAWVHP